MRTRSTDPYAQGLRKEVVLSRRPRHHDLDSGDRHHVQQNMRRVPRSKGECQDERNLGLSTKPSAQRQQRIGPQYPVERVSSFNQIAQEHIGEQGEKCRCKAQGEDCVRKSSMSRELLDAFTPKNCPGQWIRQHPAQQVVEREQPAPKPAARVVNVWQETSEQGHTSNAQSDWTFDTNGVVDCNRSSCATNQMTAIRHIRKATTMKIM